MNNKDRIELNQRKSEVIKGLVEIEKHDAFALLEAGWNYAPDVKGYKKFFLDRKHMDGYERYENGILLYVQEQHKPVIREEVSNELKSKVACFFPVTLTSDSKVFHCLFVWPTAKNVAEGKEAYGFKRFKEIFSSDVGFGRSKDFLDGKKHNVIVIGDFNVVYRPKGSNWNELVALLEGNGLKWVENKEKYTYWNVINDHCFVSNKLQSRSIIDVGLNHYCDVQSDHHSICLTIKSAENRR